MMGAVKFEIIISLFRQNHNFSQIVFSFSVKTRVLISSIIIFLPKPNANGGSREQNSGRLKATQFSRGMGIDVGCFIHGEWMDGEDGEAARAQDQGEDQKRKVA